MLHTHHQRTFGAGTIDQTLVDVLSGLIIIPPQELKPYGVETLDMKVLALPVPVLLPFPVTRIGWKVKLLLQLIKYNIKAYRGLEVRIHHS
jgi:hypothetical protein